MQYNNCFEVNPSLALKGIELHSPVIYLTEYQDKGMQNSMVYRLG